MPPIGFRSNVKHKTVLVQLTADVSALALPANYEDVLLLDADPSGPWTVQGIVCVYAGEHFHLVNTGAEGFFLGHQHAGATAVDRIISPTGANLLLGENGTAQLWYDPGAMRWRILAHTGS